MRNVFSRALLGRRSPLAPCVPAWCGRRIPNFFKPIWFRTPPIWQRIPIRSSSTLGRFAQPHDPVLGSELGENTATLYDVTFVDPSLPTGLVQFNVQDIGGHV
jgi:hypothetical protein